jgi:predicted negative regulator of RcsB-dependent stress response
MMRLTHILPGLLAGLLASAALAQDVEPGAVRLPVRAGALLELDDFDTPMIEGPTLCPGLPDDHPFRARIAEPEEAPEPAAPDETEADAETAEDTEGGEATEAAEATAEPRPELTQLEAAIVAAREARSHEAQRPARDRLRRLLDDDDDAELGGCAQIELARLELRMRLFPEASATALRARAVPQPLSARHDETAHLLQAEALYRSGDPLRAAPLFLALTQATDPIHIAAARLRLADIRFDRGKPASVLDEYRTLLPRAEDLGLDARRWEPRLLESAIAAGELGEVERYIRHKLRRLQDPVLSLRLADVLAARGEVDEARQILVDVTAHNDPSDLATLARLRLYEWGLEEDDEAGPVVALQREIDATESRTLKTYAHTLLARRLLDEGSPGEALHRMVPIAHDPREALFEDGVRDIIDGALELADRDVTGTHGCAKLIETLAYREGLTLRRSGVTAPFLTLGRCYEHFRLNHAALDLYRALARHFGGEVAASVALPIARSSLAIGEVTGARAAAQIRIDRGTDDPAWHQLLGAALLADEEFELAFEVLSALAIEHPEPETLFLLTRAARRTRLDGPARERFAAGTAAPALPKGATLGLAKLNAGRIHREAGERDLASRRYAEAADTLRRGRLDAEAHYWVGRLSPEGMAADAGPESAPFARLAGEQAQLERLRARAGLAPPGELP